MSNCFKPSVRQRVVNSSLSYVELLKHQLALRPVHMRGKKRDVTNSKRSQANWRINIGAARHGRYLTKREAEIAYFLLRHPGATAKQIAMHFKVSARTVESYMKKLYKKAAVYSKPAFLTWLNQQTLLCEHLKTYFGPGGGD